MNDDKLKQVAAGVVAQFSHFDGIEWVTNPSPHKLRAAILAALRQAVNDENEACEQIAKAEGHVGKDIAAAIRARRRK